MFWFLVFVTINVNGSVFINTQYPTSAAFNNEASCEANGQKIANEAQLELGTKNSKVFWICKNVSYETIGKIIRPTL